MPCPARLTSPSPANTSSTVSGSKHRAEKAPAIQPATVPQQSPPSFSHRHTRVASPNLTKPRKPANPPQSPEVVVEPLEGIPDKRQAHLRALLLLRRTATSAGAVPRLCGLEQRGVVRLVDLVGGEVGRVDVRRQARLERRADAAQAVELDAAEEGVVLELVGAAAAEAVLRVADQAAEYLS
jgi:hypothetical protein